MTKAKRYNRYSSEFKREAILRAGEEGVTDRAVTNLSSVIFLVSPGNELASVAILDSAINSFYGAAGAMSVTMLVIVFAVMGAMWWFERFGPVWARLGAHHAGRR